MQNNNRRQVPPYFAPPPPVQATPEIIQQTKKTSTLTKELEVVDLNSYASRKSAIGGALGISLFSSNTDQLVTLINNDTTWSTSQIVTSSALKEQCIVTASMWGQCCFFSCWMMIILYTITAREDKVAAALKGLPSLPSVTNLASNTIMTHNGISALKVSRCEN